MNRRKFLFSLGTLTATQVPILDGFPFFRGIFSARKKPALKVKDLTILELSGKNNIKAFYIKIITNTGLEGIYGPIDREAVTMVKYIFKKQIIGQDPLAIEDFWQRMYTNDRYSRGSYYSIGMSAIDNVLWDLRGRYFNQPVFRLLGGGARTSVRAYASCFGYSQEPQDLMEKARMLKRDGYTRQKWFLTENYSKSGSKGLDGDVEVVRLLREAVGTDVDLMFDAYSGWDLSYSIDWSKRVEQYIPRWLEEPFQVARVDSFIQLSRATSIPLATGEHFYGRWDLQEYLNEKAIQFVQADPEWCGGVSELIKICNIASEYGVQVIPHGHSMLAALHVVASQTEALCPLVEFLITKMTGDYQYFDKNPILPLKGIIFMPDRPGFGIELDNSKIENIRVVSG